jgi:hypothetical protein
MVLQPRLQYCKLQSERHARHVGCMQLAVHRQHDYGTSMLQSRSELIVTFIRIPVIPDVTSWMRLGGFHAHSAHGYKRTASCVNTSDVPLLLSILHDIWVHRCYFYSKTSLIWTPLSRTSINPDYKCNPYFYFSLEAHITIT